MANNIQDLSKEFQSHLNEVKALELRKNRYKEQLEDFEYRTMSAQEQLSDTDRACKQKFDELSGICSQVQMLEYKIEQIKNGQERGFAILGTICCCLPSGYKSCGIPVYKHL